MKPSWAILVAALVTSAAAADGVPADRYRIPGTVSPEAAATLKPIYEGVAAKIKAEAESPPKRPVTAEDFQKVRAPGEAAAAENFSKQADSLGVDVTEEILDGVPALRIRPRKLGRDHRLMVYLHGGAYVMGSARSTLALPSKLAVAGGYEVISIDYTLAPESKWQQTTLQVVRAWKSLLSSGTQAAATGWFGESAGAGLIAASVLRMRDEKVPMPGALYLMSPWADLTLAGDTMETLVAYDPLIPIGDVEWVAAAYADARDQKNPYVSPVYADFGKGAYPPTLITAGTREVLLSASVRLYQALRAGGRDATLDVYEGMPHVFQGFVPDSPEGVAAFKRATDFFAAHLKR